MTKATTEPRLLLRVDPRRRKPSDEERLDDEGFSLKKPIYPRDKANLPPGTASADGEGSGM